MIKWALLIPALVFAAMLGLSGLAENAPEPIFAAEVKAPTYAKDVQPILAASCYECHNAKKKKKGVDLQSGFAGVQKIVSPMKPEDSKLFKCLIGKGGKLMPPNNSLPEEQIAKIKTWIANGAKEK